MESKKFRDILGAYSSIYEKKHEPEMEEGEEKEEEEHKGKKKEKKEKEKEEEGGEEEMEESADLFDRILEHLVAEGYADTNKAALAIMANMSEEWKQSIVEELEQLDEISDTKVQKMLKGRDRQDRDSGGISAGYMARRRAHQAAARRNQRTGSNVKVDSDLAG